jgi:hypothetical protein
MVSYVLQPELAVLLKYFKNSPQGISVSLQMKKYDYYC